MPLPLYPSKIEPLSKVTHIVGVGAGKGGVGKSTLALHLAIALKNRGKKVGILDADVYGPSLQKMFPYRMPPSREGEFLIPASRDGIKLISLAYFQKNDSAAVVRAPIANETILQFLKKTVWGDLDYLIVDFPPGTGDVQLTLLQEAPFAGSVLVTTPQDVALIDVIKAHECFDRLNVATLGVIENMSFLSFGGERIFPMGEGGGAKLARQIGCPLLAQVPLEPSISLGGDCGKSLFEQNEHLSATQSMIRAAARLNQFFSDHGGLRQFEFEMHPRHEVCDVNEKLEGNAEVVGIKKIFQSGAKDVVIEWTDGAVTRYDLGDIQRHCPCARCTEHKSPVFGDPLYLKSVGRYGIRFKFTKGCSAGIYRFDVLRALKGIR